MDVHWQTTIWSLIWKRWESQTTSAPRRQCLLTVEMVYFLPRRATSCLLVVFFVFRKHPLSSQNPGWLPPSWVATVGFELLILPLPPKYWDHRPFMAHQTIISLIILVLLIVILRLCLMKSSPRLAFLYSIIWKENLTFFLPLRTCCDMLTRTSLGDGDYWIQTLDFSICSWQHPLSHSFFSFLSSFLKITHEEMYFKTILWHTFNFAVSLKVILRQLHSCIRSILTTFTTYTLFKKSPSEVVWKKRPHRLLRSGTIKNCGLLE